MSVENLREQAPFERAIDCLIEANTHLETDSDEHFRRLLKQLLFYAGQRLVLEIAIASDQTKPEPGPPY